MKGFYHKGAYCIASNKPMLLGKLLDVSIMRPDVELERVQYAEQDNASRATFATMFQKYEAAETEELKQAYMQEMSSIVKRKPKELRKFTPKTLRFRVSGNGEGFVKLELVSKWPKQWPLPEDTFNSEREG